MGIHGEYALVYGCDYDPGSHYSKNGAEAPSNLGGGAGYTAFKTTMELVGGSWKVEQSYTTAPPSSAVPGPCHGFE